MWTDILFISFGFEEGNFKKKMLIKIGVDSGDTVAFMAKPPVTKFSPLTSQVTKFSLEKPFHK